jgi:hypothetical protein
VLKAILPHPATVVGWADGADHAFYYERARVLMVGFHDRGRHRSTEACSRSSARLHGNAIQSVPVKETFGDETVWEGIVHVFKINGQGEDGLRLVLTDREKREATVLCGAASAPGYVPGGGSKSGDRGGALDKMKSALASFEHRCRTSPLALKVILEAWMRLLRLHIWISARCARRRNDLEMTTARRRDLHVPNGVGGKIPFS